MHYQNYSAEPLKNRDYLQRIALQRYSSGGNSFRRTSGFNELEGIDLAFVQLIVQCFTNPGHFPKERLLNHTLPVIIDYLRRTHKLYLSKRLPEIAQSISILAQNYDHNHPLLTMLHEFFLDYTDHLEEHIELEEFQLFPYIESLINASTKTATHGLEPSSSSPFRLSEFVDEHSDTEQDISEIRHIISHYTPSHTNATPYRVLLTQLESLELDLHIHGRIEEEVLIPKALQIEQGLLVSSQI